MKRLTAKITAGVNQQSLAVELMVSVPVSTAAETLSIFSELAHKFIPSSFDAGTLSPPSSVHSSKSSFLGQALVLGNQLKAQEHVEQSLRSKKTGDRPLFCTKYDQPALDGSAGLIIWEGK